MTTQGSADEVSGGGSALHIIATNKVARGRYRIAARRGGQPVHVDVLDPSHARRRGEFVEATLGVLVCKASALGIAISPGETAAFGRIAADFGFELAGAVDDAAEAGGEDIEE